MRQFLWRIRNLSYLHNILVVVTNDTGTTLSKCRGASNVFFMANKPDIGKTCCEATWSVIATYFLVLQSNELPKCLVFAGCITLLVPGARLVSQQKPNDRGHCPATCDQSDRICVVWPNWQMYTCCAFYIFVWTQRKLNPMYAVSKQIKLFDLIDLLFLRVLSLGMFDVDSGRVSITCHRGFQVFKCYHFGIGLRNQKMFIKVHWRYFLY